MWSLNCLLKLLEIIHNNTLHLKLFSKPVYFKNTVLKILKTSILKKKIKTFEREKGDEVIFIIYNYLHILFIILNVFIF